MRSPEAISHRKKPQPVEAAIVPSALLSIKTVAALIDRSRSSIHSDVAAGRFPAPMRLTPRCVRWRASEVTAWLDAQGRSK